MNMAKKIQRYIYMYTHIISIEYYIKNIILL